MSDGRTYLEKGAKLLLRRENSRHTDEWEILDKIGEGGSSVCYFAQTGNIQGRLKEFNPVGSVSGGESPKDFLAAYRIIEKVKSKDTRYLVLNNYIPHYEILFGSDKKDNYNGVYVWTPDDKSGTDFSNYLREVRANPYVDSEQKLANIIDIVYTLTDCICLLHSAGILHLDLKPSNFLVTYNSRMELNTGNISLFDINTIYSIENDTMLAVGTDGYCAPEVNSGAADNRSDIYSIGAILFNAIVIAEPVADGIYRNEYYDSIECLLAGSKLMRGSASNSSVELREKLAGIMQKCLAYRPKDRYDYCEQLMEDLLEARRLVDYKQPAGQGARCAADVLKVGTNGNAAETSEAGMNAKTAGEASSDIANISEIPIGGGVEKNGSRGNALNRISKRVRIIAAAAALIIVCAGSLLLGSALQRLSDKQNGSVTFTDERASGETDPSSLNTDGTVRTEMSETVDRNTDRAASDLQNDSAPVDSDTGTWSAKATVYEENTELTGKINARLKDEYINGIEKEFTLSPETLGTDLLVPSDNICIRPFQKLTISKDMKLACMNAHVIDMRSGSELVVETRNSFVQPLEYGCFFIVMNNNCKLTIDGVTFYTDGSNDWANAYVSWCMEENDKRCIHFGVLSDMHVSCDYDTFCAKGFSYHLEFRDEPYIPGFPLDHQAIYFEGSDEPYDIIYQEDFKGFWEYDAASLQSEIYDTYDRGERELLLERSVKVFTGEHLYIPEGFTLTLADSATLECDKDASVVTYGTLVVNDINQLILADAYTEPENCITDTGYSAVELAVNGKLQLEGVEFKYEFSEYDSVPEQDRWIFDWFYYDVLYKYGSRWFTCVKEHATISDPEDHFKAMGIQTATIESGIFTYIGADGAAKVKSIFDSRYSSYDAAVNSDSVTYEWMDREATDLEIVNAYLDYICWCRNYIDDKWTYVASESYDIDFELVIHNGEELVITAGSTLRLLENGSITCEDGGSVVYTDAFTNQYGNEIPLGRIVDVNGEEQIIDSVTGKNGPDE